MMRPILMLCGVVAAAVLSGCGGDASPKPPQEATKPVQITDEARAANTQFALTMLQQLDDPNADDNLCFSPLSLSLALSMTLNGAEGETYDAIAKTLGYTEQKLDAVNAQARALSRLLKPTDESITTHMANGLWVQQGFPLKPDFLRALLNHYETRTETVDFRNAEAAANAINTWVKEQTQGLIEKLFQAGDFDAQTRLALVNTLYFEGAWQHPFPKDATQDAPFYLERGETRQVPMMRLSERLPYYKGEGFEAVALPYGEGDYRFYLFLPDKGRTVADLRKQLTPENWGKWLGAFRVVQGSLQMPRFKIEAKYDLKPPLSALGMGVAFDPDRADFSRIADVSPERLFIQKAIQKAVVEVDEEGTKAAAATGITVGVTSVPVDQFSLVADRPFLFAIVHQPTGTVLFLGVVRQPGA
ncbi:serpin family protein [Synechococcus sp. R55.8]|uniref:serpin family protein n=1 Tax=Synechococcus sp. R55.8 TaxID=2964501 RepID=UPI0039C29968